MRERQARFNTPNHDLEDAISTRDLRLIRSAILDGADINAPAGGIRQPLWREFITLQDTDTVSHPLLTKIFELFITNAKPVLATGRDGPKGAIPNDIAQLRNADAASLVVIAGIRESQGDAKIDLNSIFSTQGKSGKPYSAPRAEIKARVMAVHERTRLRLLDPQTSFEQTAAEGLAFNRDYWLKPLKVPDLAELPTPSSAYLLVSQRYIEAAFGYDRLLLSTASTQRKRPLPQGLKTELILSQADVHEAQCEIERLRERNMIGMKLPRPTGPEKYEL